MRNISKKIKDLRTSLGLRQSEFAKAVGGVDQSTVSKWEIGTQKPGTEHMMKIAGLANLSPQQFMGIAPPGEDAPVGRSVRVTGELQAGSWQEAVDWADDDQYDVPAPLGEEWDSFPIHARVVRGASMNRIYPEGTVVYVVSTAALGRKPLNGERVAVQRVDEAGNYEATLKEYVVGDDGKVWLWPRSYDPMHQTPLAYASGRRRDTNVTIVGVVIASFIVEARQP